MYFDAEWQSCIYFGFHLLLKEELLSSAHFSCYIFRDLIQEEVKEYHYNIGIISHLQLGWSGDHITSQYLSSTKFSFKGIFFQCNSQHSLHVLSSRAVHRCLYLTTHDWIHASCSAKDPYLIDSVLTILSNLDVFKSSKTQSKTSWR